MPLNKRFFKDPALFCKKQLFVGGEIITPDGRLKGRGLFIHLLPIRWRCGNAGSEKYVVYNKSCDIACCVYIFLTRCNSDVFN